MACTTRCAALLVALLLVPLLPAAAQQSPKKPAGGVPDVMQWIADHYEITEIYRQGETERALELLATRSIEEQRHIAEQIFGLLEMRRRRAAQGLAPGPMHVRWQIHTTNVAGALHMEAALRAYRRDDAASAREVGEQIKIAEAFLDFYERYAGKPNESRRWQLAIGLTAMADGRFRWADTLLHDACERLPGDNALQLACGSIDETIGMLPANVASGIGRGSAIRPFEDNPLTEEDESRTARARGSINPLGEAKSARDRRLKDAARAFERVLASDPADQEAKLRLAHVRVLQTNDKAAAALLEPIAAATPAPPPRIAYLARLFLGGIHERQRQTARAARLFEEAVTLVPSGQSAYVALLKLARNTGDPEQAAGVLRRMLRAPAQPHDPWIGYRFGQFWIPDQLLAELRKEVQKP